MHRTKLRRYRASPTELAGAVLLLGAALGACDAGEPSPAGSDAQHDVREGHVPSSSDDDSIAPTDALPAVRAADAHVASLDAHVASVDAQVPFHDDGSTMPPDAAAQEQARSVLDDVRTRWAELTQQNGARYWYEEVNCERDAGGIATIVQVDHEQAQLVSSRNASPAECEVSVNRSRSLGALTIPELYDLCEDILEHPPLRHRPEEPDPVVYVESDDSGLIRRCYRDRGPLNCGGPCGAGYWLRQLAFGDAPTRGADCRVRAAERCDTAECDVLRGQRIDPARRCAGPVTVVGCNAPGAGCDDAITFARAPTGELWRFPNSCIPRGWAEELTEETSQLASVSRCP